MDYEKKARDVLHDHNLKATRPRVRILAYLMSHHDHPTVEMLNAAINDDQKKLATIYNTLNSLEEIGVVIEIKNGDNSTHYDYFEKPHFHIICTNCGTISDVFYPNFGQIKQQMQNEARSQTGYTISRSHVEMYGLCPNCQRKLATQKEA
ncbi:Fur family transcriptional regulator [Lactobacillus corticis]|uniref:Fur family transcriptional regulator n=1 Tax=Lactobacillus corticis TaxID=2201249 RepID=A0A916QIT1_9LACO|nr:Fur family transcriptional regulator [Lactobacillus corticis]GFZ27173.1 Fur family transcriptional regulator [Lactobacillus corticis]